jgi:hypothetical protein
MSACRIVALAALLVLASCVIPMAWRAHGEEHRHPTGTITGTTAQFYESWMRPDTPELSCCNKADCYATPSRHRGGRIQALHRESGEWIDIPDEKVELNRDSPDGLSHLCANPEKFVFCFKEGGGT